MFKTGLAAVVATAFVLLLAPAATLAGPNDESGPAAASCVECCEGDSVCQALALLADVRNTVERLVPEKGIANSLEVKVDAATESVLASRYGTALNQLDAFSNEVSASNKIASLVSSLLQLRHEMLKGVIQNLRT